MALARAALVNSDVLILDEATSDLDPGTELVAAGGRYAALYAGWLRGTHHL